MLRAFFSAIYYTWKITIRKDYRVMAEYLAMHYKITQNQSKEILVKVKDFDKAEKTAKIIGPGKPYKQVMRAIIAHQKPKQILQT